MTDQATKIEYNWFTDTQTETVLTPLQELKEYRNCLLKECDWTVLPDNGLSAEKVTEWKTYRQALRDLPTSHTTVAQQKAPTFPTQPS